MKNTIFYLLFITLAFLSCNKNDYRRIPISVGSIDSAGVFEDFELWVPPSNSIYIDPTNLNDDEKDGSIEHPYSSFSEINWKDNTVYALKRNTLLKCGQIRIQGNGITLASYGKGKRPIIQCTDNSASSGNKHAIISDWDGIDNTVIRDLEITAAQATSCIRFLSNCQDIKIINCKLHDSNWGFRSISNNNVYVYNTEVFNIYDDGMFLESNNGIEIANCYVYNVNLNFKPPSTPESKAAGDGVQFQDCNNWYVHHNIIDRGNSGNKFCFISNNKNQNNGVVEFNIFSGPYTNGACVYFHNGRNIIVRYNYFKAPSQSPIFAHSTGNLIYGNIFDGLSRPAITTSDAQFFNNVFYNMDLCIQGGSIEAVNNVYDITKNGKVYQVSNLSESNNLYVSGEATERSYSGDPGFTNPATGDFHLTKESDCIDKGIAVGIQYDMEGNSIPQGENPDIGAFEYQFLSEE
jgi:hypothetical protein